MMARSSPTLRMPRLKNWMFWIPCQWRTFPNPCGLCWWVLLRPKRLAVLQIKMVSNMIIHFKSLSFFQKKDSLSCLYDPPFFWYLSPFPPALAMVRRLPRAMGLWRNPSAKLLRVCRHGGSCSRKEGFGEMKMEPIGLKITPCEVVGKIS